MTIDSRAFGSIDVDDKQIISFPKGILGFEDHHDFALLDASQAPFYWLQSLSNAQTAFVLISPDVFRKDYELSVVSAELELLEIVQKDDGDLVYRGSDESAELLVLSIVTVTADKNQMTANLQGPIIINPRDRLGMQGIQTDAKWKTKHFILQEMSQGEGG
ncbi:flagellar assembly protein FliW [Salinispira pacifica]|uniref:Flagellar assembly factor FliW n=1 Tax=Salinispira pacifica TaxID=1307761 RepID=V5WHI8_9SPIO|nr:flagellar assembly protein FliW [Salinispira pacifica]AHC14631.1 Flagellar assembly factor FliW [Salinispira pacifica]